MARILGLVDWSGSGEADALVETMRDRFPHPPGAPGAFRKSVKGAVALGLVSGGQSFAAGLREIDEARCVVSYCGFMSGDRFGVPGERPRSRRRRMLESRVAVPRARRRFSEASARHVHDRAVRRGAGNAAPRGGSERVFPRVLFERARSFRLRLVDRAARVPPRLETDQPRRRRRASRLRLPLRELDLLRRYRAPSVRRVPFPRPRVEAGRTGDLFPVRGAVRSGRIPPEPGHRRARRAHAQAQETPSGGSSRGATRPRSA